MLIEGRVGPQVLTDGAVAPPRLLKDGLQGVSDVHARYQEAVYRGSVYSAQVANANPTGVSTGILGAAGTPLLLIWNPVGTGKLLVILQTFIAMRNNGTVSPGSFVWSAGPTAAITANLSQPLNLCTLQAAGSSAKFVANAAATGLSALSYVRPILGVGAGTAVTVTGFPQGYEETAGGIFVPQGCAAAIISTVTGTAAVVDAGIVWEEISA